MMFDFVVIFFLISNVLVPLLHSHLDYLGQLLCYHYLHPLNLKKKKKIFFVLSLSCHLQLNESIQCFQRCGKIRISERLNICKTVTIFSSRSSLLSVSNQIRAFSSRDKKIVFFFLTSEVSMMPVISIVIWMFVFGI